MNSAAEPTCDEGDGDRGLRHPKAGDGCQGRRARHGCADSVPSSEDASGAGTAPVDPAPVLQSDKSSDAMPPSRP